MSNVKPIKSAKTLNCPHCNLVPHTTHDNYSCPRISRVALEDGQIIEVEYISAQEYGLMIRDLQKDADDKV